MEIENIDTPWQWLAFEIGKKRAYEKLSQMFWHDYIIEHIDEEIISNSMKEWAHQKFQKSSANIFMITVNPRDDVDLDILNKKVEKAIKKKYIDHFMYCYEWREENKGLHCHIRIVTNKKKKRSEIKREFYNTFKHLVGNSMHVDVKYGCRKDSYIDYIKGIKNGQPKENSKHDTIMREKHGLPAWVVSH